MDPTSSQKQATINRKIMSEVTKINQHFLKAIFPPVAILAQANWSQWDEARSLSRWLEVAILRDAEWHWRGYGVVLTTAFALTG